MLQNKFRSLKALGQTQELARLPAPQPGRLRLSLPERASPVAGGTEPLVVPPLRQEPVGQSLSPATLDALLRRNLGE